MRHFSPSAVLTSAAAASKSVQGCTAAAALLTARSISRGMAANATWAGVDSLANYETAKEARRWPWPSPSPLHLL